MSYQIPRGGPLTAKEKEMRLEALKKAGMA